MSNIVSAAATGLPIAHPRLVELIERRKLRLKIEAAVSRLIDVLDEIDPDPEFEPEGNDEPSLGWPNRKPGGMQSTFGNTSDLEGSGDVEDPDLEDGHDAEEEYEGDDDPDKEPSLGAPELLVQPLAWSCCADGGMDIENVNGVDRLTWKAVHA